LIDIILKTVLTLNENIIDQIIIPIEKEKKLTTQIFAKNKEPKKYITIPTNPKKNKNYFEF